MARDLLLHCTNIAAPAPVDRQGPPPSGVIAVHYATIEELRPRNSELLALLDVHEMDRAERFVHDVDRERYVLGHGYLREVLSLATGRDPKAIGFRRGVHGKPVMEDAVLHFNFSDTKDAVLVAVGHEELGVDIETMLRRVDHRSVAEHYFTAEEVREIEGAGAGNRAGTGAGAGAGAGGDERKRRFLEFWTRKEAILKASGVGIMDDLKVLRVDVERNVVRIAHGAFVEMAAAEYHVRTFALGRDHLVSVASQRADMLELHSSP